MITYEERRLIEDELSRNIQLNPNYGMAAYKLIYQLIYRIRHSTPVGNSLDMYMDRITTGKLAPSELSDAFSQLIRVAFECAVESDRPLLYTTGQIAEFFGVSTTTVNNWLRNKRIQYPGMDEKPSYKQARIPDNAIYQSANGQVTVIREVAQTYDAQKSAEPLYDEVERMKQLVQTLMRFETQYGGNYKETVSRLGDPKSSDDWMWRRDADEWRYVMKEISRER